MKILWKIYIVLLGVLYGQCSFGAGDGVTMSYWEQKILDIDHLTSQPSHEEIKKYVVFDLGYITFEQHPLVEFFVQAFTEKEYGFDSNGRPCPIMRSGNVRKEDLQRLVRCIAQNPAGRIVLVRLLVEIRRPIDNGYFGIDEKVFKTGTCNELSNYRIGNSGQQQSSQSPVPQNKLQKNMYPYITRLRNRSIVVNFVEDSEKGSCFKYENSTIDVGDYKRKYTCVPIEGPISYSLMQRDSVIAFYHELGHWFRFLVHPERFLIEQNIRLRNLNFNNVNFFEEKQSVEFYSKSVLLFYFSHLFSNLPAMNLTLTLWESSLEESKSVFFPNNIPCRGRYKRIEIEEIRNILGMPSCEKMQKYYNGGLIFGVQKQFIDGYKKTYVEGDSDVFENYFRKYEHGKKRFFCHKELFEEESDEEENEEKEGTYGKEYEFMRIGHGNIKEGQNREKLYEVYKSVIKLARLDLNNEDSDDENRNDN